jgi:hypothetical protein
MKIENNQPEPMVPLTQAPCSECNARATDWLTNYMESWNGPKAKWTKKQKDKWCEYLGVLTLFAKNFHFPNAPSEPSGQK